MNRAPFCLRPNVGTALEHLIADVPGQRSNGLLRNFRALGKSGFIMCLRSNA
jgi:hypothetical protein